MAKKVKRASKLTVAKANKIDNLILDKRPNSRKGLKGLLDKEDVNFKIEDVTYMGYEQGVRVVLTGNGKRYVRPKGGFVYSIFK